VHQLVLLSLKLVIIDCHCHLASSKVLPPQFFDAWSRTIQANLPHHLDPSQASRVGQLLRDLNEDPQSVKLIAEMEAAGIDLAVLLVIDFGVVYKYLEIMIEVLYIEYRKM